MSETIKVTAICTRSVDYRENDRLLELCTLEKGKLTAVARGAKKAAAKLKFATAPFCFGEYMLAGSNGKYVVCDCAEIESFGKISDDLESYYTGFAVLEALSKTLLEFQPNADAVLAAVRGLKNICFDGIAPYAALNGFLSDLLNALGYNLDFSVCSSCGNILNGEAVFTVADGIICQNCAGFDGIRISETQLNCLKAPLECSDEGISKSANIVLRNIVYLLLNVKINCLNTAL